MSNESKSFVPVARQAKSDKKTTINRRRYRYAVIEMHSYHDVRVFERF